MLPVSFDDDPPYVVLGDTRQGFRLMLLPASLPDDHEPITPLWNLNCGDARSMYAAARWCDVRRGDWPAWAAIAENDGMEALAAYIADLIVRAPIGEAQATLVQKDPDPRVLKLGELIASSLGVYQQILYRHRFSTTGKRRRFFEWLISNGDNGSPETLLDLGVQEGTGALAKVLERIALGDAPDLAVRKAA